VDESRPSAEDLLILRDTDMFTDEEWGVSIHNYVLAAPILDAWDFVLEVIDMYTSEDEDRLCAIAVCLMEPLLAGRTSESPRLIPLIRSVTDARVVSVLQTSLFDGDIPHDVEAAMRQTIATNDHCEASLTAQCRTRSARDATRR
jgi:hypothetical protein